MTDSYYMYSAVRVHQFEMKDKCIEFVINVSRQGNNEDKIEFKNEFAEMNLPWKKMTTHQDFV